MVQHDSPARGGSDEPLEPPLDPPLSQEKSVLCSNFESGFMLVCESEFKVFKGMRCVLDLRLVSKAYCLSDRECVWLEA